MSDPNNNNTDPAAPTEEKKLSKKYVFLGDKFGRVVSFWVMAYSLSIASRRDSPKPLRRKLRRRRRLRRPPMLLRRRL